MWRLSRIIYRTINPCDPKYLLILGQGGKEILGLKIMAIRAISSEYQWHIIGGFSRS